MDSFKQVRCFEDLEVGMFIRGSYGEIRIILGVGGRITYWNMGLEVFNEFTEASSFEDCVHAWSYTYRGVTQ